MTRVFISYRRHDTQAVAAHLHRLLTDHLPEATIFLDVASLAPADDYPRQLDEAVRSADWCLVLIGHNWLERTATGALRLDDRADVVRREVSAAITAGVATLPITVDGAPMPPTDLLAVARRARLTRFQRATLSTAAIPPADVGPHLPRCCASNAGAGPAAPIPPRAGRASGRGPTATSGTSYEFRSPTAPTSTPDDAPAAAARPGSYTFEVVRGGARRRRTGCAASGTAARERDAEGCRSARRPTTPRARASSSARPCSGGSDRRHPPCSCSGHRVRPRRRTSWSGRLQPRATRRRCGTPQPGHRSTAGACPRDLNVTCCLPGLHTSWSRSGHGQRRRPPRHRR